MSQDLLYSILPRPVNNPVSKDKVGIKKINKIPKKGIVDEEQTTLPDEFLMPSADKKSDINKDKSPKSDDGLDTYA